MRAPSAWCWVVRLPQGGDILQPRLCPQVKLIQIPKPAKGGRPASLVPSPLYSGERVKAGTPTSPSAFSEEPTRTSAFPRHPSPREYKGEGAGSLLRK